ncbi:restriction endonuclease subunit S [Halomonas sp. DN3]|uniref:restriction endonuclease subunit S n=1 Tax=Halomonas sp. DN3 TaxID=2953657 RepID=UPI00209EBACE|nr:restriction endonuclease subunit S [Halomonas sp. DN3]USZ48826.1 restriction endonuclease subunit S [Halomonas sp. DN3]
MKDEKQALVPRLRFPKFRDAEEWVPKKLGDKDVSEFVKKRLSLSELSLDTYVSTENILPDFGGIASASKLPPSGSFTAYKNGDILIANIRPYLRKAWVANRSGGASNDVVVIRPKGRSNNVFLPFLLKNEVFINYVMRGAKGVKMPRGDVALMKEYPLALPGSDEQQKIADCLSSLDAMIAAQVDKLDALKTHKKGLIQQLFPREGETVPRLRFPEFRGAGEWGETTLGQLVDIRSGYSPSRYNLTGKAQYPFLKVEDLNNCEKYQSSSREYSNDELGVIPCGSVVFPKRGAAILKNKVRINSLEVLMDTNLMAITPRSSVLAEFLYYMIVAEGLSKIADTSAIPQINNKHITPYVVRLPRKPEQKKIADCLSSCDALITAQVKKLKALKNHKDGLMQQLFPDVEGTMS